MLSLREAYRDELLKIIHEDKRVICLEADLGGHDHPIAKDAPSQFLNLGIAEHTMINVAAGMSKEGLIPFASTFVPFAILRACEAIKLSMGYMGWNIKLICPYGGVSGAWFGPTHHCLEDFAIISSFPGIAIGAPHGENEMRGMVRWAYQYKGPVYLRLGRNGKFPNRTYLDPLVYPRPRRVAEWSEDALITIVSVGEIGTELATMVQESLAASKIHCNHLHLPFPDANGRKAAIPILENTARIMVIEEHRSSCGIGTMMQSLLPQVPILRCGANDDWISQGGSHESILESLGLSLNTILKKTKQLFSSSVDNKNGGSYEKEAYRIFGI